MKTSQSMYKKKHIETSHTEGNRAKAHVRYLSNLPIQKDTTHLRKRAYPLKG